MAKFKTGQTNTTVWLKHKTKQVYKGERKGEDYGIFEGTVDTGGGKMLTIKIYENTEPVQLDSGETAMAVKVSKWKGTPKPAKAKNKSW